MTRSRLLTSRLMTLLLLLALTATLGIVLPTAIVGCTSAHRSADMVPAAGQTMQQSAGPQHDLRRHERALPGVDGVDETVIIVKKDTDDGQDTSSRLGDYSGQAGNGGGGASPAGPDAPAPTDTQGAKPAEQPGKTVSPEVEVLNEQLALEQKQLKKVENRLREVTQRGDVASGERLKRQGQQLADNIQRLEQERESQLGLDNRPARKQPADAKAMIARVTAGSLLARRVGPDGEVIKPQAADEPELLPMPLQATDVDASVTGFIATVGVKQRFANPFDTKIEAVYVFPLPQDSAVTDFLMVVGDRTIRGIIREREEAERIYAAAKRQGHTASLLTQERPNIFTQKVANIEPGKDVDIQLTYFQTLPYADGEFSFRFPMTIGPRYNPAGWSDPVHATPHGKQPANNQGTNITYTKPNQDTGHRVSLALTLDAGIDIAGFNSPSHDLKHERLEGTAHRFSLETSEDKGTLADRDFVLNYTLAGDGLRTTMLTHHEPGEKHGHFTIMAYPPRQMDDLPEQPLEMVFLIDRSGSMSGAPISAVKTAMLKALDFMTADDALQIVVFSGSPQPLFSQPVPATKDNIRKARKFINSLQARGGTNMLPAVKTALGMGPSLGDGGERNRFVCLMTDGFIGNEVQIVQAIHADRGETRVMTFGVGSSPNGFLIGRAAKSGRGVASWLGLNDDGSQTMQRFWHRVRRPALTQLSLSMPGGEGVDLSVRRLPDVFVGKPVVISGRFNALDHGVPGSAVLGGLVGGEPVEITVPGKALKIAAGKTDPLGRIWARDAIATLMDEAAVFPDREDDLRPQVMDLALNHNLMSAYTAFVAVDSSRVTSGDTGVTIQQPLPVPHGVKYETTVAEQ